MDYLSSQVKSGESVRGISVHGAQTHWHQLDKERGEINMPSGAYIFFIARQIPEILKKYLKTNFLLSEEMACFYMSIMTCPN